MLNPVSSAAGHAVLKVVEEEKLQQHALKMGQYLLSELAQLKKHHPIISDVRGKGLYIGIEISKADRPDKPDAHNASAIVEKLRNRNILLSTDGPEHNVIKIKPPMVINSKDIDKLVQGLKQELKNLPV